MTLDGVLTFLALVVAVYTIASPVARLRIRLEIRFLQICAAVLAVSLTLYLEFFEALKQACPAAFRAVCGWITLPTDNSFTAKEAAFLVVLVWVLFAWLIHRYSKLGPSSLPDLSKLVDELLFESRFAELFKLVTPHLNLIDRISRRKLRTQKLHDVVKGMVGGGPLEELLRQLDDAETQRLRARFPEWSKPAISRLHIFIPPMRREEKQAQDILRSLYRAEEARRFMARQRPYVAIPLLKLERFERFEFFDRFLSDLIGDPGSILYLEARENQTNGRHGYTFPEHNQLLHFLFSDAQHAFKLSAWKPIGEHVLRHLDPAFDPDYQRFLNGPATHFDEECWSDCTFVGVQYFRFMTVSAAHQGIAWHMWLYYLPCDALMGS